MMADILLLTGAFLASAVEMVEALTLVFAMGVTRGWRSPLIGSAAALIVLGITIAILGPLIADLPLAPLRVVIGGLLAIFGLQWLRKAILRASGYKALHDEDAIFARGLRNPVTLATRCAPAWTGTPLPSPSRVSCSKGWKWRSSS